MKRPEIYRRSLYSRCTRRRRALLYFKSSDEATRFYTPELHNASIILTFKCIC